MNRTIEKIYPWVAALLGTVAIDFADLQMDITKAERSDILQAITGIASILAGFLGTALSIVISFFDRSIFRRIQHNNADKDLVNYILSSIVSLVLLSVTCILLMIWDEASRLNSVSTYAFSFLIISSTLTTYRIYSPVKTIVHDVRTN